MFVSTQHHPRRISLAISGLFSLMIGTVILLQPTYFVHGIAWFYGFFILSSGIAMVFFHVLEGRGIASMVQGATGVIIGLLLIMYPDMSFRIAMAFISIWLLTIGLSQALCGILLRSMAIGLVMFASGIFSIAMAAMLLFFPVIPLLAIGAYMIVYGIVLLITSAQKSLYDRSLR